MPTYELNLNLKNDATGAIVSTETITNSHVLGKPDALTAKVRLLVDQIVKAISVAKAAQEAEAKLGRFRPDVLKRKTARRK